MSKDPTPRADQLRQQREEKYGHLQAKATPREAQYEGQMLKPPPEPAKMGRPRADKPTRKLVPYAGKDSTGIAPKEPTGTSGKPKPGRVRLRKKENRT